jgi:anthranilate phosphoribosyltransferase
VTDFLLLNCSAALVVCERSSSFKEGVDVARNVLENGMALSVLEAFLTQ